MGFSEVELLLSGVLGSCARSCICSYLASLRNTAGLTSLALRGKEDKHEAYCLTAGNGSHRSINAGGYRHPGGSCCASCRVSDRVRREGITAFGLLCGSTVHGD